MIDIVVLAQQCAPKVEVATLKGLVRQESGFNPYAIGVVDKQGNGVHLQHQPKNISEALATVRVLIKNDWNFSLGLTQVNLKNLAAYGLTIETAFDPCENLRAGAAILEECFDRGMPYDGNKQKALRNALSCYYSGNFTTGYKTGYVNSVVSHTIRYNSKTSATPSR